MADFSIIDGAALVPGMQKVKERGEKEETCQQTV